MLLGIFQRDRLVVPSQRSIGKEEVLISIVRLMQEYGVGPGEVIALNPGQLPYTAHYLLRLRSGEPAEVVAGPFDMSEVPTVVSFEELPFCAQYGRLETYHVSGTAI